MCQPSRRCLCSGALSLRVLPLIAVRRFIAKLQPSLTGYRNQEFMLGCSRTKQMKNALYVVNHKSNCVACVQGNKASFCLDPTNYSYFKIIYQEIKISLFHLLLLFFFTFSPLSYYRHQKDERTKLMRLEMYKVGSTVQANCVKGFCLYSFFLKVF